MRPIDKGKNPLDENDNPITVLDYHDWRSLLIDRIGDYCVYCNAPLLFNLNVEHVVPIKPPVGYKAGDKLIWENVLLACGPCNLKKTNQIVDPAYHYFPTVNNTQLAFDVHVGSDYAIVIPAQGLSTEQTKKAQTTVSELFGLDNIDRDKNITDLRWKRRYEAYLLAENTYKAYLILYVSAPFDAVNLVIQSAKTAGFWSIWYNQFINEPDVLAALLDTSKNGFPGTAVNCFDAANGYRPIPRNPNDPVDTI